jgi:hypothetical protein
MPGPRKNLTPLDMKMMGLAFNQGGVINFLGKQPEVTAPVRAQSHADSPPVQLAYITDAEKDLLVKSNIHGSMDGKPNPGPAGLESLDDFFTTPGGGIGGGSTADATRPDRPDDPVLGGGGYTGSGSQSGNQGGGTSAEDYGIQPGMAVGSDGTVYNTTDFVPAPGQADKPGNLVEVLPDKQKELEALAAKKQAETLAKLGIEQSKTLTDTLLGKAGDIKTKIMGGGEGGNLDLTKEEAYANLPAGMHPLRKQYEYLKEKYGPNWANTTQAKVLEGYLSGVSVERGGGLGARDDTYGGGKFAEVDQFGNPIDPEQFEVAEKFRQQLLSSMGLAGSNIGGINTMGTVAEQLGALSDTDYNKLRYGLSPEQFFNFNQQLMAADPSAGNEAYKAARPFSSGAGLGALADKVFPGANIFGSLAGGLFPERDLSGFENYADYEQAGAGFRPLPVPDQNNQTGPIRPPGFMPIIPLPDPSQPERPRYPLPGDPKRPPFGPPFMPDGGNFPLPVGINAFNPMFLGPSFRGSPYTNRGVSPAFYDALRRFA